MKVWSLFFLVFLLLSPTLGEDTGERTFPPKISAEETDSETEAADNSVPVL